MATRGPPLVCRKCGEPPRVYSLKENAGIVLGCECNDVRHSEDSMPYEMTLHELSEDWTLQHTISCPDCEKTWTFTNITEELSRKVDAAMHYVEKHDEKIPDKAAFGDQQCPECLDIHGINGTASCANCGHIPEEARA